MSYGLHAWLAAAPAGYVIPACPCAHLLGEAASYVATVLSEVLSMGNCEDGGTARHNDVVRERAQGQGGRGHGHARWVPYRVR